MITTNFLLQFFLLSVFQVKKTNLTPIERPTSPRIVTNKWHHKYTWMRPIVLSIFIQKQPIPLPHCPHMTVWILLEHLFTRGIQKRAREQYLGSLKETLNKSRKIYGSSTVDPYQKWVTNTSGTQRDCTCTTREVVQWIHFTTVRAVRYPWPAPFCFVNDDFITTS